MKVNWKWAGVLNKLRKIKNDTFQVKMTWHIVSKLQYFVVLACDWHDKKKLTIVTQISLVNGFFKWEIKLLYRKTFVFF